MDTVSLIPNWWLSVDEPIGLVVGLIVVLMLIRQKLWAWPLGVLYVLISISVLLEQKAYANLVLHVCAFLPMNLYGWFFWLFGGEARDDLPVTLTPTRMWLYLLILCVVGTLALGYFFDTQTDHGYPYWDSTILALSLGAMYLTARKKIENWWIWVVVNLLSIPFYWVLDLKLYAGLYFVYLGMAFWGYYEWNRDMRAAAT